MKINASLSGVSLHYEKHKANDVSVNGLQRHNERVPGQKHSNKNIDDSRTEDNVFLKRSSDKYNKRVSSIIDENRNGGLKGDKERGIKGVRKDAVRMIEATVQLSGQVLEQSESEQEQVLRDMYEWLKAKHGEENIVSAVIHKDETTMHLHFDFVPIKDGELVANKILTKKTLREYQSDSLEYLREKHSRLNFERGSGELNGLSQKAFEKLQDERKELLQGVDDAYSELVEREERIIQKEKALDERVKLQDKRDKSLDEREAVISVKDQQADKKLEEASKTSQEANVRLLGVKEREQANEAREKSLERRERALRADILKSEQLIEMLNKIKKDLSARWSNIVKGFRNGEITHIQAIEQMENAKPDDAFRIGENDLSFVNDLKSKDEGLQL